MVLEIGRVCIKTVGHEADQKCVVVDTSGEGFVIVAGPRVKKRRCNIKHLELLPHKIDIKKGAAENEIKDALLKAGFISEKELPNKPTDYTPKPRGGERKVEVKPASPKKAVVKAKK